MQPIRDLDQIRSFVSGTGPTAFFDLPWMPFYLIIIYMLHPSLGLLATAGAVLSVLLTLVAEGLGRASSRRATEAVISRTAYAEAGRRNAEVIRAMGLSSRFGRLWSEQSLRFLKDQRRVSDVVGGSRRAVADAEDDAAVADARAWRLSGDQRRGVVGRHHRLLDHACPGARPRRHRHRQLARLHVGPPELCAAVEDADGLCRPQPADGAAAAAAGAVGRRP